MMLAAVITVFECLKMIRRLIRVRRSTAPAPAL
jgi:hypothetical protein